MKKKLAIALLCVLLACCLSGCDQIKWTDEADEIEEASSNSLFERINVGDEKSEEDTIVESIPELGDVLSSFEPTAEIINATLLENTCQIGDVIYKDGNTVEEIMSMIDSSSVDWIYTYQPDRIVVGGGIDTIDVFYSDDSNRVFRIIAVNYTKDEPLALSDCCCSALQLTTDITEGIYFPGGYDMTGKNAPTFDELDEQFNSLEDLADNRERLFKNQYQGQDYIDYKITYVIASGFERVYLEKFDAEINQLNAEHTFRFERDTGKCTGVFGNKSTGCVFYH